MRSGSDVWQLRSLPCVLFPLAVSVTALHLSLLLRSDTDRMLRVRCLECRTLGMSPGDPRFIARNVDSIYPVCLCSVPGLPPPLWGYRVTEWVVSGAILTTRGDIRDQLTPVCPVYTITHLDPGLVTLNRLQWSKDHQPQNVTRLWSLILSQLTGWMSDSRRGLSLAWKLQTTASFFTTPETFPCSGNILLPLVPGQEDFAVKRFSLKEKINRGGGKENYMILLIYEGVTKSFSNLSDWLRHSFQVKSSWSLIDKTKQWNKNSSNIFTQHLVM